MHSARIVWSRLRENQPSSGEPGTQLPTTTAPMVSTPPMSDASTTFPGRMRYIHRPVKSAIGIVQAMVNVPHDEPGTTWEQPADRMYEIATRSVLPVNEMRESLCSIRT